MQRSHEIDALRGLAVIGVLLAHFRGLAPVDWAIYDWFRFEAGVALFFAISGAVISATLIPRLVDGAPKRVLAGFYIRRVFRIFPLAFLWLALGIAGTMLFNANGSFGDLRANLFGAAAAALNFANIAQAKIIIHGMGMFGAYWSLSLEEQFYLVFPLFLVLVPARFRLAAIGAVLLLLAAMWRKSAGSYTLLDAFAIDPILCGIAAYMVAPRIAARVPVGRVLFFALLVMLLAVPMRILGSGVAYTVVGLLCGAIVLLALAGKGWAPDPAGVLSWVGRRSYGLYLAHGPCIAATLELQLPVAMRIAVWLVLTFGITELLYRFVELPLIAQGKRRAQAIESRTEKTDNNDAELALTPRSSA